MLRSAAAIWGGAPKPISLSARPLAAPCTSSYRPLDVIQPATRLLRSSITRCPLLNPRTPPSPRGDSCTNVRAAKGQGSSGSPRKARRKKETAPEEQVPAEADAGPTLKARRKRKGESAHHTLEQQAGGEAAAAAAAAAPETQQAFLPSEEQQRAINIVMSGGNLFLTGCAGTGKSATLSDIRLKLREKYGKDFESKVAVVALTGLAATLVEGVTLHSLLKIKKAENFGNFQRIEEDPQVLSLLLRLGTIIIDESGMLSGEMLQTLEVHITKARKKAARAAVLEEESIRGVKLSKEEVAELLAQYDKPFGGLQVIVSGDFFQLSPVPKKKDHADRSVHAHATPPGKPGAREIQFENRGFMFQAPAFHYGELELVELTKVFRQEDQEHVSLLNDIRCGPDDVCAAALKNIIHRCSRDLDCSVGIKPTLLYATNKLVEKKNQEELELLPGALAVLHAAEAVVVEAEPPGRHYLPLQQEGLLSKHEYEELEKGLDEESSIRKGLPGAPRLLQELQGAARERALELRMEWRGTAEKLLWDIHVRTFHRSQAEQQVILKEDAQVMLVRNIDLGSQLVNGSRGVVTCFKKADLEKTDKLYAQCMKYAEAAGCGSEMHRYLSKNPYVPVVRFLNEEQRAITPAIFDAHVPGYGRCVRIQCPLKLAWAITVHKSQGLTLDRAIINLNDFFGHGMLYTALSRVRSLAGLQVKGTTWRKMDPEVRRWWSAHLAGHPYDMNRLPHMDPPWCWQDVRLRKVLGFTHNPQARAWHAAWLAAGAAAGSPHAELAAVYFQLQELMTLGRPLVGVDLQGPLERLGALQRTLQEAEAMEVAEVEVGEMRQLALPAPAEVVVPAVVEVGEVAVPAEAVVEVGEVAMPAEVEVVVPAEVETEVGEVAFPAPAEVVVPAVVEVGEVAVPAEAVAEVGEVAVPAEAEAEAGEVALPAPAEVVVPAEVEAEVGEMAVPAVVEAEVGVVVPAPAEAEAREVAVPAEAGGEEAEEAAGLTAGQQEGQ